MDPSCPESLLGRTPEPSRQAAPPPLPGLGCALRSAPPPRALLVVLGLATLCGLAGVAAPRHAVAAGGFVAMVEGEPIRRYELEREVRRRIASLQRDISSQVLEEEKARLRRQVLDDLILKRLLLHRCNLEKIEVSDRDLDAFLDQRLAAARGDGHQIRDRDDFLRQVASQSGETEQEVREFFREQVRLGRLYRSRVFRDDFVSPAELRAVFHENRDRFATETRHVFRMLLVWRSNPDAERVLKEVEDELAKGTDFETLVTRHSEGPRRNEGGIYERTDKELDDFHRPLPEVVRGLAAGQISPRVSSPHAIHIIRMERREPGALLSFEQAQDQIREAILTRRRELQLERFEREVLSTGTYEILSVD